MPSRVSNLEAYVETLRKQSRIDMYDTNAFADLRGHIVEFPRHTQSIIKKNAAQIRRFALQANDWERHNFGISYSFFPANHFRKTEHVNEAWWIWRVLLRLCLKGPSSTANVELAICQQSFMIFVLNKRLCLWIVFCSCTYSWQWFN